MQLTQDIINLCEAEALGQTLAGWGDLTYTQIVEALYDSDPAVLENSFFVRWDALDKMTNAELADYIESLMRAFCLVAMAALEGEQHP